MVDRYISQVFWPFWDWVSDKHLLFVYPINGLGDNGEYFRVLNSNSLYRVNGDSYDNVA